MIFGRKKRQIVRLLIVEDEPLIAFDTEYFLAAANYVIVGTVDRVADALAVIAREATIDLVLVDVRLADGSGLDVAQAAQARDIPVLFVTGNFPPEARPLATGFLAKPYAQRDLIGSIAAIEATIDGRRPKKLPAGLKIFIEG